MRRSSNQDSLAVSLAEGSSQWKSHGHLFVVADGMGAHAAGELASKMATDTVPHSYHKRSEVTPSEAIVEAVREANQVIYTKGSNSVDFHGMGTTCSCLLVLPQGALAAHVGDSRVYRLRGNCFEQLTFDHSLVWEMAAAGHASEDEIPAYVPKNVITRSLGPHPTVSVDVEGPFSVQTGDRFLLCSDGLTGPLKPELIGAVVGCLPLNEAAQTLIDLANLLGGPDNITTIVVEIAESEKLGMAAPPEETHEPPRRFKRSRGIHPLCWVAMVVSAILGIALATNQSFGGAFLSAAAFLVAALVAWTQRDTTSGACHSGSSVGIHGKAPYRRHDCQPGPATIATLGDIVRQLEDLEGQNTWEVDWPAIHRDRQTAHEAITKGNYQDAVIAYCSAVRRLMQALRNSKRTAASDSSVDLC
ncbi:putative protein phosphatase 2C-type [Bythopirellula polymerisocia]|uniref:PPM-type phosphatase domain-containing protein n=2 Tax=Bythopirellula polymerisocia TaxID=2528003 RepID=A0A5C6CJ36_9BACT|nr:putative protein phosphatase 2C-type [Bythopirellula polymerisocia]